MNNSFNFNLFDKNFVIKFDKYGQQSSGNVLLQCEDTVVLTVINYLNNEIKNNYFGLQINFVEKFYAIGMIPGGFQKREGKPSDHAILTSRTIDRTFRPLFDPNIRTEIQSITNLFTTDHSINHKVIGIIATSLAFANSEIPLNKLVGACEVCFLDDKFIVNPTLDQRKESLFSLIASGTGDVINMIELDGKEAPENIVNEAMKVASDAIKQTIKMQQKATSHIKKNKINYLKYDCELETVTCPKILESKFKSFLEKYFQHSANSETGKKLLENFFQDNANDLRDAIGVDDLNLWSTAIKNITTKELTNKIITEKIRPDGRELDQIRDLEASVDTLPLVHGSGLFSRGKTQVLSITTLGSLRDYQIIENSNLDENKYFMHQYNFPAFSVGDVKKLLPPNRREIGHGLLGEVALKNVLPSIEEFPYVIRQVSEVLSSNGSTSQASICAACISLMAAGVPIKNHIAGISIGLIQNEKENILLTDIQGFEDHVGCMDFKLASTDKGICAIQLDTKIEGLTLDLIKQSISKALKANATIIKTLKEAIPVPRQEVSEYAPTYKSFYINPQKIKLVIGSGGKTINQIIEKNDNVKIEIEDTGRVVLYHKNKQVIANVEAEISDICHEPTIGDIYEACNIVSIKDFGIFVRFHKDNEGLIPKGFLENLQVDINKLKEGQLINVKIKNVENGKVKLDLANFIGLEKARENFVPSKRNFGSRYNRDGNSRNNNRNERSGRFNRDRSNNNFNRDRSNNFNKGAKRNNNSRFNKR